MKINLTLEFETLVHDMNHWWVEEEETCRFDNSSLVDSYGLFKESLLDYVGLNRARLSVFFQAK